ncbi:PaaI family thioesterase [uncultured Methanobrevibacter sp.]|uniref:PaaI family thioesterase n=1 Tax=uncultured Methanobrevibacter sp. TaxID=253161 RepID=UPI0025F7B21D|nr:PaaI family thioesterase [uncultured Methanobrevibacter sp.]MEE1133973.1 PaaI family thioesterase [Methanobrevibacter sp.]
MANFEDIESAREFFYKDKYAVMTGVTLDELTEDEAICSLEITDDHKNAYGGVMGGVMFTLADFTFAVLSNQIHQLTVAQQVDIHYLSAPKGEKLIAKATCRKNGRTSSIINVDISDDTGRDVAQFIGTGFKL